MRFKSIKASNFGCFKDWECPEIKGNFIIIYGKNESGKTTLSRLISTLLYGWNPVSQNPYMPWDGNLAECSGILEEDTGAEFLVYRRLKNRPGGYIMSSDRKQELSNRPVMQVKGVSEDIFNEVYALTIDEMAFPSSDIWQGIQDQLLGGQYIKLFNPVSKVAKELKDEAGGLWRYNRQGNALDKKLSAKYGELKQRFNEAVSNDEEMRKIETEINDIEQNIKNLSEKKLALIQYVNHFERIYPVYKRLKKIESLKESSGDIEKYNNIPDNIDDVLRDIKQSVSSLKDEYKTYLSKKDRLTALVDSFTDEDKRVYEMKDIIEKLAAEQAQYEQYINKLKQLDYEILKLEERLKIKSSDLLLNEIDENMYAPLLKIDEHNLKSAISNLRIENQKYNDQQNQVSALKIKNRTARIPSIILWASVLMVAAGFAGMFIFKGSYQSIISGLVSVTGGILMIMYAFLNPGRHDAYELKEAEKKLKDISSARETAAKSVKTQLEGLDIRPERLDALDDMLLMDVLNMKDLYFKLRDDYNIKKECESSINTYEKRSLSITGGCGMKPAALISDNVTKLSEKLKIAEMHYSDSSIALHQIDDINYNLKTLNGKIEEAEKRYNFLIKGLESLNGLDLEQKINDLKERKEAFRLMMSLKAELEHDYPDIDDYKAEISKEEKNGTEWVYDDNGIAKAKFELDEIEQKINVQNLRKGSLKKDMEHRSLMESADEIKGAMEDIESQRDAAARQRDKLMLLRNIILKSESIYREQNQPDVLLKSGRYLSLITGGRYNKIYGGEENNTLSVMSDYRDIPIDADYNNLSRGTIEQIYMSLKLALADHLDENRERLPLLFDELFINWDNVRTENAIEVFNQIIKQRQVFLFTCHKETAQLFSSECNAEIIKL